MSEILDNKINVIFKNNVYVLNVNMRSWLEYEKRTGKGIGTDINNIYLGKMQESIDFLACTLRYTDKFYEDTDEEMILKEEDFKKLCEDKMSLLIHLSGWIRVILYENFYKDEEENTIKKKTETEAKI